MSVELIERDGLYGVIISDADLRYTHYFDTPDEALREAANIFQRMRLKKSWPRT